MLNLVMPYPVYTLERLEILPGATLVNEQVAAEIAALGRLKTWEIMPLLHYGTVQADLLRFMAIPPYKAIFADSEGMNQLLAPMQQASLPLPLLKALDFFRQHDFHTYRHILMVFSLSTLLLQKQAPAESWLQDYFMAGPSHDIGKLCVPLRVLKKLSPLTPQEQDLFNYHPVSGYLLLTYYLGDHQHPVARVALAHHERGTGTGYPRGITDLDPMVEMVAACDVYDALLSPRPYRPLSYDNRTALEELTGMAEAHELSWDCVEALVACNRPGRSTDQPVVVSREKRGAPPVGKC